MSDAQSLIDKLNDDSLEVRLDSLKALMAKVDSGELPRPVTGEDINNHIHTNYSFSPYSPAKALWMAWNAGLKTAGIVDHDSISGAREFIAAGEIIGMATTIGVECRVDMSKTPLAGRRINNTDQNSVAYIVLHGVPHTRIDAVSDFFKPYVEKRNFRNRQMIDNINTMLGDHGIRIDFEKDVLPLSLYRKGGSVTERHISLALARKMTGRYGKGAGLVAFLKEKLKLSIDPKMEKMLADGGNSFYEYDLLGFIKSEFIASFYIDATDECPDVKEAIALAVRIGAISAYAYLGDVGDSVTGDKRPQKFEDDYLDQLFEVIHGLGFNAVTYMPPRNTAAQLSRVKDLCEKYGFLQISGVDINSPRQAFVCKEMQDPKFDNLKESTWALIGHETAATEDLSQGMFSRQTVQKHPDLNERIALFRKIGLQKQGDR